MKKDIYLCMMAAFLAVGCQTGRHPITAITLDDAQHYTPVYSAIPADPNFHIPTTSQSKSTMASLIHAPNIQKQRT